MILKYNEINRCYKWINPIYIFLFFHLPIFFIAHFLNDDWYLNVGSQPKNLNLESFFYGLIIYLIFISVFSLTGALRTNDLSVNSNLDRVSDFSNSNLYFGYFVTLVLIYFLCFVLLFKEFAFNPSYFNEIGVEGNLGLGRTYANRVPGITSLIQCGVVIFIQASIYEVYGLNSKRKITFRLICALIFISIVFRAFVISERLALIEVSIAFFVSIIPIISINKIVFKLLPILSITGLFIVFGVFEYFRSWINHYQYFYDSYILFVFDRLSAYFIMSVNSAWSYLLFDEYNSYPWITNQWIFKLPGMESLNNIYDIEYIKYMSYLYYNLNAEFNNIYPVFSIIHDYGFLSVFYISVLAYVTKLIYSSYCNLGFGLFIYPYFFVGILELSRTYTFSSSRAFPIYIFIFILFILYKLRVRK